MPYRAWETARMCAPWLPACALLGCVATETEHVDRLGQLGEVERESNTGNGAEKQHRLAPAARLWTLVWTLVLLHIPPCMFCLTVSTSPFSKPLLNNAWSSEQLQRQRRSDLCGKPAMCQYSAVAKLYRCLGARPPQQLQVLAMRGEPAICQYSPVATLYLQVLVKRGEAVSSTEGPIVVCTRNDALQAVVDATPPNRRSGAAPTLAFCERSRSTVARTH